jgi:hypothetical protein
MTVAVERSSACTLIPERLFRRLTTRIATEHGVSCAYAERVMDQALAFLGACATISEPLSPSPEVDIGWHTFILYTADYAKFCDQVAGRFLHHVPDDDPAAPEVGDPVDLTERTVSAIEAAGYHVDRELWAKRPLCSQCHNGCYNDPPPNPPPRR